jgi:hypothetical protein
MKSISECVSESNMETIVLNDIMNEIINNLSFYYFNLIVIYQESKLMKLVFEDDKSVYGICFPSEYPNCPPSIFASNGESVCCPLEALLEWENDESLSTTTCEYINNTIKIFNEQMIA